MEWKRVGLVWPPNDSSFALTFDGAWVKARRGKGTTVTIDWLGMRKPMRLVDLYMEYWLAIPPPPRDQAYSDYVECKIAGELD